MDVVAIVGAGPAGLAAAKELASRPDLFQVLLIDRNKKPGRKLLATGNGKCNLSNLDIRPEKYHGDIDAVFDWVNQFKAEPYFQDLGLCLRAKGNLLYPYSEQAQSVLDCFWNDLKEKGVIYMPERTIVDFQVNKGRHVLIDDKNQHIYADHMVLAGGGKASRQLGSDGSLLELVKNKGVLVSKLYPSLVQLKTKPAYKQLKGTRVHGTFFLYRDQQLVTGCKGEVLFTEDGVSGIAALELSSYLSHEPGVKQEIELNLADELEVSQLRSYFQKWQHQTHCLDGLLAKKIASILEDPPITSAKTLISRVCHWRLEVIGTRGFDFAQVTSGGILLQELDAYLMLKRFPGVYACGEILNVDGDCGGYNLHFAWASGQRVGRRILQTCEMADEESVS